MPRLPAEWEPQAAVMLTWPHAGTDWQPQLPAAMMLYERLALLITAHQGLLAVCHSQREREMVAAHLAAMQVPRERVQFAIAPSNDTWARDHGPLTVLAPDGAPVLVDFRFNGWGGKFEAALDDQITPTLHAQGVFGDAALVTSPLVLEGGAIESDGQGTLLAVRRTLIDPARNPGWDAAQIEAELSRCLGSDRVLWLEQGQLTGDDTDGHIDTLARFCDPQTIAYAACDDPDDPDYLPLTAMADELAGLRDRRGQPYRLIALPQPAPILDRASGARLPAGYANFLIINDAVLVPVYDDPADAIALERLGMAFPDRRIEPLDCRTLIRQGGSLHCISMQLPAAVRLSE